MIRNIVNAILNNFTLTYFTNETTRYYTVINIAKAAGRSKTVRRASTFTPNVNHAQLVSVHCVEEFMNVRIRLTPRPIFSIWSPDMAVSVTNYETAMLCTDVIDDSFKVVQFILKRCNLAPLVSIL